MLLLEDHFFTVHARTFGKYTRGKKSATILIPEITLVIFLSAQTSAPIAFLAVSRVTMTPGCRRLPALVCPQGLLGRPQVFRAALHLSLECSLGTGATVVLAVPPGFTLCHSWGFGVSLSTQCIMGKAFVLSGQAGDSNVLTMPPSDPHTLSPCFLQCPPPHEWPPRYPDSFLLLILV